MEKWGDEFQKLANLDNNKNHNINAMKEFLRICNYYQIAELSLDYEDSRRNVRYLAGLFGYGTFTICC